MVWNAVFPTYNYLLLDDQLVDFITILKIDIQTRPNFTFAHCQRSYNLYSILEDRGACGGGGSFRWQDVVVLRRVQCPFERLSEQDRHPFGWPSFGKKG